MERWSFDGELARASVSRESNGTPTVFLFGGASHCEDAIHGEDVVFRQVATVEEPWSFQEESLALEVAREFTEGHVHEGVSTPAFIVQNASLAAPEFGRWASPH